MNGQKIERYYVEKLNFMNFSNTSFSAFCNSHVGAISISESLEDFTEYQKRLEDLARNFITKYHELIYQKFMNNELQKEEMQL